MLDAMPAVWAAPRISVKAARTNVRSRLRTRSERGHPQQPTTPPSSLAVLGLFRAPQAGAPSARQCPAMRARGGQIVTRVSCSVSESAGRLFCLYHRRPQAAYCTNLKACTDVLRSHAKNSVPSLFSHAPGKSLRLVAALEEEKKRGSSLFAGLIHSPLPVASRLF